MVRNRVIQTIKYGHFKEALEALTELNRVCVEKGLNSSSFWSPLSGINNELIIETEYESLADFERDSAGFYSDPDVMSLWRSAAEYVIEGSGRSELLETSPSLV
jgi:hypothetical protein